MLSPERTLEAAEAVRRAYMAERKLEKLTVKIEAGHEHLAPFRDRVETNLRGKS